MPKTHTEREPIDVGSMVPSLEDLDKFIARVRALEGPVKRTGEQLDLAVDAADALGINLNMGIAGPFVDALKGDLNGAETLRKIICPERAIRVSQYEEYRVELQDNCSATSVVSGRHRIESIARALAVLDHVRDRVIWLRDHRR